MNLINVCRQPKDSSTIVLALKNLFYCMSRCATGCFARSLSPAQTAITKATQSSSNSCGNPLSGCTTQTNQNRQDVLHIFSNQHLPTEHKNLPGYLTTFKADFFSNWISPPDSNLRCQKGILKEYTSDSCVASNETHRLACTFLGLRTSDLVPATLCKQMSKNFGLQKLVSTC